MAYRFTIDGSIVNEVGNIVGWEGIVSTLERDASTLKGLLVSLDVTLTFVGDMYRYFYNKFYGTGICDETDIVIEWIEPDGVVITRIFQGKILNASIKLSELHGEAKCKLIDDSFYARINNNKSISTVPNAGRSKNDISITKAPVYHVDMFRCDTGAFVDEAPSFFLYDVFRYLVDFMSDGEVGFASNFLLNDLQIMVTNGYAIRTGGLSTPNWATSFERMFKNLYRTRKCSFAIEYDINYKPILRIEEDAYWYSTTQVMTFTDPIAFIASIKETELYGKVKFGSQTIADFTYLSWLENVRFNGFKEEEMHILGQCNIDNTLDLVRDVVLSSNVIEDSLVQNNPDWDDELCWIEVENLNIGALTADAKMSNPYGATPPQFYNMGLINSKSALSHFATFQGSIASFINILSNDFQGNITASKQWSDITVPPIPLGGTPLAFDPLVYNTEIDFGGNFDLATYTCPEVGFYTFGFTVRYNVSGLYSGINSMEVWFIIDNFLGQPAIQLYNVHNTSLPLGNGNFVFTMSGQFYAPAPGALVRSILQLRLTGTFTQPVHQIFTLKPDTRFFAFQTPTSGGLYADYDPADVKLVQMQLDYPLTLQEFQTIKNNTRGLYAVALTQARNRLYKGWIDKIKYNHKEQMANIILKSSFNVAD